MYKPGLLEFQPGLWIEIIQLIRKLTFGHRCSDEQDYCRFGRLIKASLMEQLDRLSDPKNLPSPPRIRPRAHRAPIRRLAERHPVC